MFTNVVFGDSNSVLFIKVSLFQGVLLRGNPLYVYREALEESQLTFESLFFLGVPSSGSGAAF